VPLIIHIASCGVPLSLPAVLSVNSASWFHRGLPGCVPACLLTRRLPNRTQASVRDFAARDAIPRPPRCWTLSREISRRVVARRPAGSPSHHVGMSFFCFIRPSFWARSHARCNPRCTLLAPPYSLFRGGRRSFLDDQILPRAARMHLSKTCRFSPLDLSPYRSLSTIPFPGFVCPCSL